MASERVIVFWILLLLVLVVWCVEKNEILLVKEDLYPEER